uniref:Uncharacterized protein n=1 Tax=Pithovirus LCPAC406 TaxID=2506599 RepID=A0A481ZE53_9VIRU|nr:MAG: hypothetical protein LCPAC406_02300 [Pithovirus LCPAC406]
MTDRLCGSTNTATGNPCARPLGKARLQRGEQHCSYHNKDVIEKKKKETHKICNACDEKKLLGEFHNDKRGKYRVKSTCKECVNASVRSRNYPRKAKGIKECISCKESKDVLSFGSDKNCSKDGLLSTCKECINSVRRSINYPRLTEGTFRCSSCDKIKDVKLFGPCKSVLRGLSTNCRECVNSINNPRQATGTKKCFTCKETKNVSLFYKNKRNKNGLTSSCIECTKIYSANRLMNFNAYMDDKYASMKSGHKERGLDMSITKKAFFRLYDDQKEICPGTHFNLQCVMKCDTNKNSRIHTGHYFNISSDRIDSNLGYIEGNVQLVTVGYNIIKGTLKESFLFRLCHDIDSHSEKISTSKKAKIDSIMEAFIRFKVTKARYRSRNSTKNIGFDLIPIQVYKMYEDQGGVCNISGRMITSNTDNRLRPKVGRHHFREENYMNLSIDRIDSSGDYTIDNIQLVSSCINFMKKDMCQDIFLKFCKAIAKAHPQDIES